MAQKPHQTRRNGQPLVLSYLRFSTPEQAKGDSIRRQIEASERWAEAKGWAVDDRLRDAGVSAFRGNNATTGALGRILKHIESGTIPKGSYLVIENLDRLSRSDLLEAIELFTGIVRRGITLVTLSDGREYHRDNFDLTSLILSASELSRSGQESKRKSELVGAAWRQKKSEDARNGKPITAKLPAWLEIRGGKIVPIESKAAIVREIFSLALEGRGRHQIAKYLNTKYGKSIARGYWSDTYVLTILRNKAVIGEFQPHRLAYVERTDSEGKRYKVKTRTPEGEPIADYFPQVIDPKIFYAVQKALERRRKDGGRNGDNAVLNLWQGVMFDEKGFSIVSHNNKAWRRYYVSSRRDGRGDTHTTKDLLAFPADMLDYVLLLRLFDLRLKEDENETAGSIDLQAVDGELAELDRKLAELGELVLTKPLPTLITAIEKGEARKAELERQKEDALADQYRRTELQSDSWITSTEMLQRVLKGELKPDERLALREAIRRRVKRIDVTFGKSKAATRDYVADIRIKLLQRYRVADFDQFLKTGIRPRNEKGLKWTETDTITFNFGLKYTDYRHEGYNKDNPYQLTFE